MLSARRAHAFVSSWETYREITIQAPHPTSVLPSSSALFCFAGVLGDAAAIAEQLEANAAPNTISCSVAAKAAYLSSGYLFTPSEYTVTSFLPEVPPSGSLRASENVRVGNNFVERRFSAPSVSVSCRRADCIADGGSATHYCEDATSTCVATSTPSHSNQAPRVLCRHPFVGRSSTRDLPPTMGAKPYVAAFIVQPAESADAAFCVMR